MDKTNPNSIQNAILVNNVRQKLKRVLNKFDEERTGFTGRDKFFQALEQVGVTLNSNDKMTLKRKFIEQGGLLPIMGLYKQLYIDDDTAEWHLKGMSVLSKINMSLGLDQ